MECFILTEIDRIGFTIIVIYYYIGTLYVIIYKL